MKLSPNHLQDGIAGTASDPTRVPVRQNKTSILARAGNKQRLFQSFVSIGTGGATTKTKKQKQMKQTEAIQYIADPSQRGERVDFLQSLDTGECSVAKR